MADTTVVLSIIINAHVPTTLCLKAIKDNSTALNSSRLMSSLHFGHSSWLNWCEPPRSISDWTLQTSGGANSLERVTE